MAFKHTLLASSALLAAAMAVSAHAQTAANSTVNTIEELVITAEKREQSLQDVPVAVSAFTAERREIVGINSLQDMTNFTPGLVYNTSTDRISLRGVGRLTNVLTGDAAVANYNDGVYETFAVQAGRSTLFLDRVEVLRGPQGTLYGRNAIGGAINEVSKRPTEEMFAEVRATYANYDHAILEGAMSGPITDKIQFRVAADWDRQTQGWVDNVVPGMPDEGGVINEWFAEVQLQGKFFDDKLEFWGKYGMGVWHNGAGGPGSQSEGWTNAPFPTWEFGPSGIQLNSGYGCSTGFGVTNVVNVSPLGCTNPGYDPNGHSKSAARTIARAIPYHVRLPVYNTEAFHLTWHAKDFDIKYITGGVNYHYQLTGPTQTAGGNLGNGSATPVTFYQLASGARIFPQESFYYREYNQFWSHEVNILSTWDKPLQYVLGAYYFNQHINQPVYTTFAQQPEWNGPFLAPAVFCSNTGGVCAPETGARRYDNQPRSESTSYAFFGQLDWQATDAWKFTGGLRYSHDRKQGQEQVRILCWGAPTCYGVPGEVFGANIPVTDITAFSVFNPAPGTPLPKGITSRTTFDPKTGLAGRTYDATWDAVTGTAGVEWQPDAGTNAYFKYSRGYKSGGFYVGIFTFLAPNAYSDKESVDSFEIGLKKDFSSRLQTNFAAYYYKYDNLQVPISVFSGFGQIATNFYNVPKSISKGIEAEITWIPIDNLQLLFSYSYNDAYIKHGTALDTADPAGVEVGAKPIGAATLCALAVAGSAPCDPFTGILQRTQKLDGQQLPNAPKNKFAINATYTFRDVLGGDVAASASYIYRDVQFGALFTRGYNKAPDWNQVDARLTWTQKDNKQRVILFVKNVFNDLNYDAGAFGNRFVGSSINPATGATVNFNQGIFKTYSVAPPRTYGIEIQHKFF